MKKKESCRIYMHHARSNLCTYVCTYIHMCVCVRASVSDGPTYVQKSINTYTCLQTNCVWIGLIVRVCRCALTNMMRSLSNLFIHKNDLCVHTQTQTWCVWSCLWVRVRRCVWLCLSVRTYAHAQSDLFIHILTAYICTHELTYKHKHTHPVGPGDILSR